MEQTPTPPLSRMCKGFTSLAWIEPNGKIHWMSTRYTHGSWAFVYYNPDREGSAYIPDSAQSSERLRQEGWIRVSSATDIDVRNINSISQEAWDAWSTIVTSCAGQIPPESEMTVSTDKGLSDYFKTTVGDFVEKYCSKRASEAYWSKLMGESLVRNLVRSILLEDLKGFQSRTKGIDYMANLDDPTFEDPRQGSLVNKPLAKDVKRAWAAEADHKFMDSIIKIHWTGGLDWEKKLRNFLKLSGKNEISTSGYLPGSNKFSSSWGTVGVIVKGRTTLASNDMNTVSSGYHGQVPPETLKKYASSGVPKRPLSFRGPDAWSSGSGKYILDRDSFDPRESRRSEFIVDNWRPVGIIVDMIDFLGNVQFPSVSAEPIIRYAEVVLELGLPVYDWEMKEIPKEKIEAALGGRSA